MIKQLLNSVIAKYCDLSVSRRFGNLRLPQKVNLLATDKLRHFAQPRPIIVNLGADHLTLEGGGGWVGDFEKKFPASACLKKKIVSSTNEIEKNSCTAASKKKNVAKLFQYS